MFRKMPVILLCIIFVSIALNGVIPIEVKSIFYALSLTLKSLIIFLLPFVIFMLLFRTLSQLASQATKIIFLILVAVTCSNFMSLMVSYEIGSAICQLDLSLALPKNSSGLSPAWTFVFPKLIPNEYAMFAGLFLGLFFSFFYKEFGRKISGSFETVVNKTLQFFVMIIPFFIVGFILKLIHDKVIENVFKDYALIFLITTLSLFSYIALLYFIASGFKVSRFLVCIRNIFPAALAGFSSMSSAAVMPLTILGTEKNTGDPELTRLVIPTTVNIHMMGDFVVIPIFTLAVMKNFGMPDPSFLTYLNFVGYFVLAQFSFAGIPGGGILVMLPIIERLFGFDTQMASLITALYILFDPIVTCCNISGNGFLALMISKLQKIFIARKKV